MSIVSIQKRTSHSTLKNCFSHPPFLSHSVSLFCVSLPPLLDLDTLSPSPSTSLSLSDALLTKSRLLSSELCSVIYSLFSCQHRRAVGGGRERGRRNSLIQSVPVAVDKSWLLEDPECVSHPHGDLNNFCSARWDQCRFFFYCPFSQELLLLSSV